MMSMLPKFETPRLRLRGLEEGDEEFLVQLDTNPLVMEHIHDGVISNDFAVRCASLEVDSHVNGHHKRTGKWMVLLPNPDTRIGWVEVSRAVVRNEEFRCIGYEFSPVSWGNGYATEAVCAVVAYLFESLNAPAVVAYTRPENHRSARVLQKVGFRSGGEQIDDGASIPCDVYEISLEEWQELQGARAAEMPPALDG